jgi:LysM repeat protein
MMWKSKLGQSLKALLTHGGIQLGMLVMVIGAVLIALGETALYQSTAFVQPAENIPAEVNTSPTANPTVQNTATPTPAPSSTQKATGTYTASMTMTQTETSTPTSTKTRTPSPTLTTTDPAGEVCGPPQGWVQYTVQPGDNLYQISLKFRTTVAALQAANCMGGSSIIVAGERIWVPNVATSTPEASNTPTRTNVPPTTVPTATSAATATVPTNTVAPTLTDTLEPTQTETAP